MNIRLTKADKWNSIIVARKAIMYVIHKAKPRRAATLRGFFMLTVLYISIQPFAGVIANDTCYDGDKESDYVFHVIHPPFCCQYREDSIIIILYIIKNINI